MAAAPRLRISACKQGFASGAIGAGHACRGQLCDFTARAMFGQRSVARRLALSAADGSIAE